MKPYTINVKSLRNSDARRFAKTVTGKITDDMEVVHKTIPAQPEVAEKVVEPIVEPASEPVVEPVTPPEPIVEPEKPAEPEVTGTPLDELKLSKAYINNLKSNNLTTVEQLSDFVNAGNSLESLPKIGGKAELTILEALTEWNEQNQK